MSASKGLTGWHILFMLVAFFGVMIVANAFFVIAAIRSYPGEAEEKSYFQGLHFNETLAARAAQNELGWRVEIVRLEATSLGLAFYDADEAPISGLSITGALRRPTFNGADQPLIFMETGPGAYHAQMQTLEKGVWDFAGLAEDSAGRQFEFQTRVSQQ